MAGEIAKTAIQSYEPGKGGLVRKFAAKYGVDEDKMLNTLKQTAFKQKDNVAISNEQMMALMIVADQYGLNPFTKEIFAYPDKGGIIPVVSVDGWSRIINENPQMDGIEFEYSPEVVEHKGKTCHVWIDCIIYRKDRSKPIRVREFFEEVVRAPNYPTPWDTHPKRMHRHKTEIQCARVAFGFAGIYDQDEAERIIDVNEPIVTGKPPRAGEIITTLSQSQIESIENMLADCGVSQDEFLKLMRVPSIDLIQSMRFEAAVNTIEKMHSGDGEPK